MKNITFILSLIFTLSITGGCTNSGSGEDDSRIQVIFDTDANNELDDQHALAYLLLNDTAFHVLGITVNATNNGGPVEEHLKEAQRVVDLVGWTEKVRVYKGADSNYTEIRKNLDQQGFDGSDAVDFIIREARKNRKEPLVLLPVGKLTNIALALEKDPFIAGKVRIVWLGSNYPAPGEYNLENDTAALNSILKTDVPFEMATVRYGESSGTADVKVKRKDIYVRMPGLGPVVDKPVTGRHGGTFTCFGDYSVDLFRHITSLEDGCYRSLFDMAAVAIVKDPDWAETVEIPAPLYFGNEWVEQPGNERTILIRENFNREAILDDFYATLEEASVAQSR
jgi:purine nucleosidase